MKSFIEQCEETGKPIGLTGEQLSTLINLYIDSLTEPPKGDIMDGFMKWLEMKQTT